MGYTDRSGSEADGFLFSSNKRSQRLWNNRFKRVGENINLELQTWEKCFKNEGRANTVPDLQIEKVYYQ